MQNQPSDALSDPFSVYATPRAVLDDDTLPTSSKLKVLTAMEMDIVALQNATAENMAGDEKQPARLSDVRAAIRQLDPRREAHGEAERLRHDSGDDAAVLTPEEARQGERLFDNRRQRTAFVGYIAVAAALFAIVVYLAWINV